MVEFSEYNRLNKSEKPLCIMLHKYQSYTQVTETYKCHRDQKKQKLVFKNTLKKYNLKKSFFFPHQDLELEFKKRSRITNLLIPKVEIVYKTQRWLLLQSPIYTQDFFQRLNKGELGNKSHQIIKVVNGFYQLCKMYGFFVPDKRMIFVKENKSSVWISGDLFSNHCQNVLPNQSTAEQKFIEGFLRMLNQQMNKWRSPFQKISNINELKNLLASKIVEDEIDLVKASKEVNCKPNESKQSFEAFELGGLKYSKMNKAKQEKNSNIIFAKEKKMDQSITFREDHSLFNTMSNNQNKIIKNLYEESQLRNSIEVNQPQENVERMIRKAKFALTSTSSTLEKFSDARLTYGRNSKKRMSNNEKQKDQNCQGKSHSSPKIQNIENELNCLFSQSSPGGTDDALEKINEQIEDILF